MATAFIYTPPNVIALFQRQLDDHCDDPISGACRICGRAECKSFREARFELAAAGALDWDPIRDGR